MQASCSSFAAGSLAFRPVGHAARRPAAQQLTVRASQVAEPASLPVRKLDGSEAGTASISLRVADQETANGLVHRYLVTVQRNARQVRARLAHWAG